MSQRYRQICTVHARRLKIERQKVKHEDEKLLKGTERKRLRHNKVA